MKKKSYENELPDRFFQKCRSQEIKWDDVKGM